MVDTVLATPLATVFATAMAAMAKGLLILRPMPTTATVDMVLATPLATVLATAVTASGQRTPRLTPTTAMEAMVDTVLATPLATVLATDTAVTERGLLMPSLTTDTVELTPDTDMVDTDLVLATATASKHGCMFS